MTADPADRPVESAPRDTYTHGHHESVLRSHTWRTVDNSAAYLVPHLFDGASVLDVGCGPGTITVDLARRLPAGRVLGIDASAEVVAQASGLAQSSGIVNAEFRTGDAYALDLPDDSVDIVHAHQVLQHLSRPVDALREWRRVLRPGGVLAVRDVDYGGVIWSPASAGLTRWLELYRDVHRWNGGEPDAGRHLTSWVRTAGYDEIAATGSVWVFATALEREWWGESWALRATESQFAAHAVEAGHSHPDELERIAQAWREWAADGDGWLLMPHAEVIARG
ncbi:methyltransferase domain-containing protein [Agromyces intestinalis]|uniref:Methyltransferase domain-containing protein n=1 Tax=Agromyces intestinalis TaxID=2592652 RepID=A0A5C1YIY4_9MICO|nr:methyltransferase domain-containing protein [Agromyces intestinalis]QEO15931.1 methyltransferase domain-containing protein [Agromyces intestinalis]